MDISAAVYALYSASEEEIKRHLALIESDKVDEAIRKLKKFSLKPQETISQQPQETTSQQPQETTSQQPQETTSQQSQEAISQQSQETTSQQLAQDLRNKFKEVREIFEKDPMDAIGRPPAEEVDYRLIDILVVEGKGHNVLRQAFAQLSLAVDFHNEHRGQLWTMVNNKTLNLSKLKTGSIRGYTLENFGKHGRTARDAVSIGLKLLAIGIAVSSPNMAVILAFVQRRIKNMTFQNVIKAFELSELREAEELVSAWVDKAWICYKAQGLYHSLAGTSNAIYASLGASKPKVAEISYPEQPRKKRKVSQSNKQAVMPDTTAGPTSIPEENALELRQGNGNAGSDHLDGVESYIDIQNAHQTNVNWDVNTMIDMGSLLSDWSPAESELAFGLSAK